MTMLTQLHKSSLFHLFYAALVRRAFIGFHIVCGENFYIAVDAEYDSVILRAHNDYLVVL
jgi:hypothetical protein